LRVRVAAEDSPQHRQPPCASKRSTQPATPRDSGFRNPATTVSPPGLHTATPRAARGRCPPDCASPYTMLTASNDSSGERQVQRVRLHPSRRAGARGRDVQHFGGGKSGAHHPASRSGNKPAAMSPVPQHRSENVARRIRPGRRRAASNAVRSRLMMSIEACA